MGRFLSLILKNCWRNRRRTVLTVLSIAMSLCLLGVVMAMYRAFYLAEAPAAQAQRLITRNRVSLAVPIPVYYRDKIRQAPGVSEVAILQWFQGTYKDNRDPKNQFARFAAEMDRIFTIRGEMSLPEDQKKAVLADRTAALAGRRLAETQGWKIGERITIVGDIFPVTVELTLRGIYDAPVDNETLYFHWKYLEESLSQGRQDEVGTFAILANSIDDVPRVARAVDEMFQNSPAQTRTESEQEFGRSFLAFLGNVKMFLLSICAAVTFTVLLVAANTMAMSVRERIREVGILKTIGFTQGMVLWVVLGEAVMLAAAGGALGTGLAWALCTALANSPVWAVRELAVSADVAFAALLLSALIGLVSALIPAWSASRTGIVEAVRHTG